MHEVAIMASSYNILCINKKAAVKKPKTFDKKTFLPFSTREKVY